MNSKKMLTAAGIGLFGLASIAAAIAIADPAKTSKTNAPKPEFQLPPGFTPADMQACIAAATPGKMQERLAKDAGVWHGNSTMWMGPGADPVTSECTSTLSPMMDGRYTKCEINGEMPGMGPYTGLGIYGFDNVSQKFVSTWIDNHSTGMMNGVGSLSSDGKILTWRYTFNCPITKKPTVMREVETITGEKTKTLEMFGPDPKSGKEYQMMKIELTRK